MQIASAWSTLEDPRKAANEVYEKLMRRLQGTPHLLLVHSSCACDNPAMLEQLHSLVQGAPLQGGTSCLGVLTEEGFHTRNGYGLGILGILDPEGDYGVGMAEYGGDSAQAIQSALVQALDMAARPGELPAAVVMTSSPGHEETTIAAIESYIGSSVPILGGTSADNDMSGQWRQFCNDSSCCDGISIAVLFPSGDVSYAFHSGYEPTEHKGKATQASGRILSKIDGRPAAEVYNEWTDGMIADTLPEGGSLVPTSNFSPIGHPVGHVGGIPYYRLSYPVAVLPDRSLHLFAEVLQGKEVVLMKGTPDSLINRPGRVAEAAIDAADFPGDDVCGGLFLFCAGCMLAVQERMEEVVADLKKALGGKPFLCSFTLGEQGCFIGGENRHGNLMVASLLFGPMETD